ncbi:alpha-sarcoglycan isoform X2 [Bombina bombina]|uniref:alpha-sarcoglycan isoform X2 n=1 Tax=Bombina bombina TaxID=8345 RepID=UPI00235AB054|nr:alpha-sarcoglycan isoform X2 [Bombina bombina]
MSLLLVSLPGCLLEKNVYLSLGSLFVHKLDTDYFQQQFPSIQNNYDDARTDPITFRANLEGFPDLPRWLRYTQRSPKHHAYLYGSPTEPGKQVIEVTAYNRQTFETVRERIIFNIQSSTDIQIPYKAEFLILNWDVEEMLPPEAQLDFQGPLRDVWGLQRLTVINITSALDKGGRVPLPIPGMKEGVYIKLGSELPFPDCLLESKRPQNLQLCQEGREPLISCSTRLPEKFHIDWCNLTMDLGSPTSQPPEVGAYELEGGGEFMPPSDSLEERNYIADYLLTLLLPTLIALLLCAVLSYIMCCRREGVEKRDAETSDIQLIHQHTIMTNTEELRHMAATRDVPRPLSTLPMFNVRTGQRVPPIQPHQDSARVPLILSQQ